MAAPQPPQMDDDVDFGDPSELNTGGISNARWDRVREECDVRDVVDLLHDRRGNPCGCPFHGSDTKPSFYFFPQNNSCFCFGCPDGDGHWDPIKIVARSLDIPPTKALLWLEREFKLPPLAQDTSDAEIVLELGADPDEEDDGEPELLLGIEDLREPFVRHAAALIHQDAPSQDAVTQARALLESYFRADKHEDPLPLARVLGPDVVRHLIRQKHVG